MQLIIDGHSFHYECENVCRIFYPNEKINVTDNLSYDKSDELKVFTVVTDTGSAYNALVKVYSHEGVMTANEEVEKTGESTGKALELHIARMIYHLLSSLTGYRPPWGVLTGVRPTKLCRTLEKEGGREYAEKYFTQELEVSSEKALLAFDVAHNEQRVISSVPEGSFSLYIAIPFCPSRCSYCSFVSHSIDNANARKIVPDYVKALGEEIKYTAKKLQGLPLTLSSVYFGGGTPGILSSEQFEFLLGAIENNFDLSGVKEYTVEIGRPDTVTAEKLGVLKNHGVDRVSINPQTFNGETLDLIGRRHSVEEIYSSYELAKKSGIKNINMDLIAGLPSENFEDFKRSLDCAIALDPQNITVHSLALKRSSKLNYNGAGVEDGKAAVEMLAYASSALPKGGYIPYYMYRQSKCVGNLENVGWCKRGSESFYNVIMMEECQSVIGCGAGAVTKLYTPESEKIDRVFNYKYPFEYISGFEEMKKRKDEAVRLLKEANSLG